MTRLRPHPATAHVAGIALAAMAGPAVAFVTLWVGGAGGRWNDFASYWLAGRLVAAGHSPYDLAALVRLGDRDGITFLPGTGYSYPLPFAVAMVPPSTLPFAIAAGLFTALSVVVFGLAVATWLGDRELGPLGYRGRLLAALGAGLYPPVIGSAWVGQANLLVGAMLAIGLRAWLRSGRRSRDDLAGGLWVGLAGIVKVVPLALVVPPILARRWRSVAGIGVAVLATLVLAAAVAPGGFAGMRGLGGLASADPYWTNQSLNGFASRLALPTARNVPLAAGIDPVLLAWALVGLTGMLTLVVVLRARLALRAPGGYALATGFILVAAVAAAPKDSFWNHVPVLLGAALLLAFGARGDAGEARLGDPVVASEASEASGASGASSASGAGVAGAGWRATRPTWVLLIAWGGLAPLQAGVNALPDAFLAGLGPAGSVLSSAALYGLVALWLALGGALLQRAAGARQGLRSR